MPADTLAEPTTLPAPLTTPRLLRLRAAPRRPGEASFFFHDAHFATDAVKVLPGEFFVHDEDILITTTLGSCIAACLWDRQRRIGGMNHFMLPDGIAAAGADAGRYGAYAMALLVDEMLARGASRGSMQAKVFGGGAVVSGMDAINVGERNTAFVLGYLRTERIAVVAKDVLDVHPRKVLFLPASGQVMVRRLAAAPIEALLAQEGAAARYLATPATGGGRIDLL
jgi:chemotaxis protein CheD